MGVIEDTLAEIVSQFVAWVPNIVGVVIILLIGWGFKDAVAARAKDWIKSATQTAKKAEEVQAKKSQTHLDRKRDFSERRLNRMDPIIRQRKDTRRPSQWVEVKCW